MSSLQLKYKKLKYELKYLELEVEETEDKFRECINNFEKALREKVGNDFEDPNKDKGVKLNQKKILKLKEWTQSIERLKDHDIQDIRQKTTLKKWEIFKSPKQQLKKNTKQNRKK